MNERKQSSTTYPIPFLMVDSSDHITGKTGLSPTVTISKNGASFASPSGAVSEIGSGWYKLAGNATDRDTLGPLLIHATGTGADPVDVEYEIVPYDPFDKIYAHVTSIDATVIPQINGSVSDVTPAATNWDSASGLSGTDNFYNGSVVVFTSGLLTGIARKITAYTGSSRNITVGTAFPTSPSDGDTFVIIGRIE